ncbi:hypothetical protein O181_080835 [Austropuccinia psidii MF-1]|uniref:Integrase zinc-binding domain-containing protein n=1 Tax=Austropuccinia psidii MF-1 TaxID=1389203 RepID=A0A9Q3IJA0_9BASI|nr:hypothetical protein [Austropuccinia psidii MF-1]
MTLVHKFGNICKNADGISRWALENTPENPEWVPQEEHNIEGLCGTDIGTELFHKAAESYYIEENCHTSFQLLMKYCKDPSLSSKLDEIWKKAYDEGRFLILGVILYHRTKHTCVMTMTDRTLINTILHECHDGVLAGHLSEDKTLGRVKTCSWWANWRKYITKYFQTCRRFQKANRATGKKFGIIIQIQEPNYPREIGLMDWVTALPPGGDRSFNQCIVIVDNYSKTPMFLPFHRDDTALKKAMII